jgi:hypothetical protein
MEYGLRRYEATQRLLWFLFFFICLGVAYLAIPSPPLAPSKALSMPHSIQPEVLKSFDFWFNLRWIRVEPLGKLMIYLVWVAFLFLGGRLLGLIIQYVGKYYISSLLAASVGRPEQAPKRSGLTALPPNSEVALPLLILSKKTDNILLQILFHPLRRLRVLLNDPQKTCSGEGLAEKERRLSETDWEILWSSWTPFRWLVRLLPVVGVVQTVWLLHLHLQPAIFGQKDIQEIFGLAFNASLPLIQVIFLTVVFSLSSALLKRFDSLYLSGVDALFYDRFLTKLPFQSSDTPILIEMLQSNFQELNARLSRLEQMFSEGRDSLGRWK